ncbi:MAG: redoxin family protein [Bdellovibrionales bacterium]|nr:redoxin family protein [Bdellovibrionales bacterium]
MILLMGLILCGSVSSSFAQPLAPETYLKGKDLLTQQEVQLPKEEKKGWVLVFLSATCPCSNSHIGEIKNLKEEFKDFKFVGVHSNQDEFEDFSKDYFVSAKMNFPVLQDEGAKVANQLKASRTRHAFVLDNKGEILYAGGVSDSNEFSRSHKKYLRETLAEIQKGKSPRITRTRVLGCAIGR